MAAQNKIAEAGILYLETTGVWRITLTQAATVAMTTAILFS